MRYLSRWQARGFSLVEVALALGIIGFALTAIVGLISIALNSESQSHDDSVLTAMTTQVMADLRRQRFSGVVYTSGTGPVVAGATGTTGIFPYTGATAQTSSTTSLSNYFFDASGILLGGSNGSPLTHSGAVTAGAVYQCSPSVTSGTAAGGPVTLFNVSLTFAWPVAAISTSSNPPGNAPNTRTVFTSIARY